MKMHLACVAALALFLCTAATTVAADKENKLPEAVKTVLEKATDLEIYSINPADKPKDNTTYHGFAIFGRTTVKDADKKKEVLTTVEKGLAAGKVGARCFIPRHAIRATHDGKTVDLLICFQCNWIYVYVDNKDKAEVSLTTGSEANALLNKLLTDAGVKLAPVEEKKP